jgi:hypothetical protein
MKARVSGHAIMRVRQRLGVKGGEVYRLAGRALNEGVDASNQPEIAESVKKWPKSDFKLLDGNVFVFIGKTLITAYPLGHHERAG